MRPVTFVIILIGFLAGGLLSLLSSLWPNGTILNILLLNMGSGLIATAFISIILDLFWSKERARAEREELQPFFDKFEGFAEKLNKLEGRLEAFKQLGLNYCHATRKDGLNRFLKYANELIGNSPGGVPQDKVGHRGTINIVSSSARGLMGYLDRDAREVQKQWRNLIISHPKYFRILLTHPAYAHLRQPAEERSSGDIELEILKTATYLHCIADMKEFGLRFYRGSPTVFSIQVNKHVLLNPYPYGKMAMNTLCLEFESEHENSYIADFINMHFSHTWEFVHADGKRVDGKPLVNGINCFDDILDAFSECTFLGEPKKLRLTQYQVKELDTFVDETLRGNHENFVNEPAGKNPFQNYVEQNDYACYSES